MTETQEDALYEFLENNRDPFTLDDVLGFIRLLDFSRNTHLAKEITAFIDSQNIAFHLSPGKWLSRRGCFEPLRFVISPTREDINLFQGFVDEPIYSGFQTKFYVKVKDKFLIRVIKQHAKYSDEGPDIVWKDSVYISWSAHDGYIVGVKES